MLQEQEELKRVRPEAILYAKKAKRVDVKRLKENIWRELEDMERRVRRPTMC